MATVIRLRTDVFDVSQEPENPINPIGGASVLAWLKTELHNHHAIETSDPEPEDWGWYIYASIHGHRYMIGASTDLSDPDHEWVLQVHKNRNLVQKLLGKGVMTAQDPAVVMISDIISANNAFRNISVE
ncbi:hypothetical protein [Asticcacaulis sp. 201]|uniref:hypothetical protein n=1 Tax=Asticcacaulis sp. 201 TaxID=3028787 RepID=UPI0029165E3B|nr:hypothetical protein [Asticcacaulis sp. 201]MDV6329959.1 hypothetical protein [Asticcacaulis sp. 201]